MKKLSPIATLLLILLAARPVHAEVKLASPFTSHMVLQCDQERAGLGRGRRGRSSDSGICRAESIRAGRCRRRLARRPQAHGDFSGKPDVHRLRFTDGAARSSSTTCWWAKCGWRPASRTWIFPCRKKVKYFAGVTNEEQEIAAANYPLIRMFTGDAAKAYTPQTAWAANGKFAPRKRAGIFRRRLFFRARSCSGKSKCRWASSRWRLARARRKRGFAATRWRLIQS